MKKSDLKDLPFFCDNKAITVISSDNWEILQNLTIQLTVESVSNFDSTMCYFSEPFVFGKGAQVKNRYDDLNKATKESPILELFKGDIQCELFRALGYALREDSRTRFYALVESSLGKSPSAQIWEIIRNEVNKKGKCFPMVILCNPVLHRDELFMVAEYLLDATENNGEIILTPLKYDGRPIPSKPFRLEVDKTNLLCPYNVKD